MSHCKFSSGKPFEGGSSCLKQTTARKKSRLLSRSLAFISIFCVLALLFTSLTPVVFADEMVPAPEGSETPEQPVTPADPEVPVTPEQPETPADPEVPVTPEQPETPADPEVPVTPEQPEQPNPENNFSDLNATLVIDEVVAGATEISGKIETEEALPPYDLILEIIDKDGVTHTAELKADPDATFINPEWKIGLPEDYPSLQPGDQITITIKIPETDWELSESAEVQSTQSGDSELDISDVNIPVSVGAIDVKAPTIDPVFYEATTISGKNLAKARVNKKLVIATVHVTLKGEDGTVKATLTDTPTKGTTWKVDLPGGVKVEKGDTVTVYQQIGEDKSTEVTATAQPSKASTVTLKMPTGEIWIEQTSSNQVNDDEQAEAIEMLKQANPDIANDIDIDPKSKKPKIKFSIDGTEHAYYEVTYTDGSTSGKVEAPNLKIQQVTEHSRGATLGSITIVDNVIKGQLAGEGPFDGIKVQLILKLSDAVKDSYCDGGNCLTDKDTSDPVDATVDGTTGGFTYTIPNPDLKLDQAIGVTVKEPHKFKSCSKTTVKPVIPEKTEVKDPRKLTAKDKKAIDAAIRTAYTVDGVSKLPNGSEYEGGVPAVIQFDDSGNVKIFSGGDVKGDWDWNNGGIFVPETNEDGSYKIKDGAEPKITIPSKDLVKNIAPYSPAIAVDTDKGEVTITPPAYKEPGEDTDLLSYTITYKDASGAEKTVTATRDLTTDQWSGSGVNADTGVITLKVEDIEVGGTVKAIAKDNGGLEGDTDKLDSPEVSKKLETATVSYDANKGTGKMDGKKLNKGSKYKILDNKFEAPDENQEFKAWEVDGQEVAAGTEITVTKDTVVKAVWKKNQVKVSYDANGGSGEMKPETVDKGSEYTVLPNAFKAPDDTQEFDTWEVNGKRVAPGTKIKADKDTVIKAIWKKIPVKITYDANGGSGEMKAETVDKGSEYTVLPNAFKAPDDTHEFDTWEVNGEKVAPGTKIKVDKDTVIKAIWKEMVTITFDPNGGKWNDGKTEPISTKYKKGTEIDIKEAPTREGYKFLYWKGSEYQPGEKYTAIDAEHTFVAQWKSTSVVPPVIGGINPRDIPPKYVVTPQGSMQSAPSASAPRVYKTLPRTGESNGLPLLASALLALLGGALILSRKRS